VTTAPFGTQKRIFNSPKSSIRVANLMSNGLSYPSAKKILKKSPLMSQKTNQKQRRSSFQQNDYVEQKGPVSFDIMQ